MIDIMAGQSNIRNRGRKSDDHNSTDSASGQLLKDTHNPNNIRNICGLVCKVILIVILLISAFIILLLLKTSPIDAQAFTLPPQRPFTGALTPNNKLQSAKRLLEGKVVGPESLAFKDGRIYSGTHDGKVIEICNETQIKIIAQLGEPPCGPREHEPTCGRPLGVRIYEKKLFFLDGYFGLYEMDVDGAEPVQLMSSNGNFGGRPLKLPNDLDILRNGDVIFSDSSYKWFRKDFGLLAFEGGDCGRLFRYHRDTGRTDLLLDGQCFPNGVQLSPNEDFILLVETTRYRIMKYYLKGPKTGSLEVFIDNLPGNPDNIRPSRSGGYWVGLAMVKMRLGPITMDFLAPRPWLRNAITKIIDPSHYLGYFPGYGLVLELNQEGEIVQSLHDPTGRIVNSVSEILDTGDALYFGSYHAPYLLKLDM